MKSYKQLFKGDFISVISPTDYPYEMVHEKDGVIVIPAIKLKNEYVIGIRYEHCPPYIFGDKTGNKLYYTLISGGIEKGESPKQAMVRELKEEAGIELIQYKILNKKEDIPLFKLTDSRINIYIILVDSFRAVTATGDGTENEKLSKTLFVKIPQLQKILKKPNIDNLLYSGYFLLKDAMKNLVRF